MPGPRPQRAAAVRPERIQPRIRNRIFGYLCKTGIAVYKATRLEFDDQKRLLSFYGFGKTGKLTKVYINH